MGYRQVVIAAEGFDPKLAEVVLEALGAVSITLSDAADDPVLEPGVGETPLWPHTRITALFDDDTDLSNLAEHLRDGLALDETPAFEIERLDDRAWEREWMRDLEPLRFGKRLWVCPVDSPVPDPDAVVVRLDPGLAFGTGTHPTTAMCLEWLDGIPLNGESVLDFGCGSGILAIAALKLGAATADGIDNDPQALVASRQNAERNATHLTLFAADDPPGGRYGVVVANILAGPLAELATHISEYVKSGGRLALSGILEEQAASVRQAYEPWFEFDDPKAIARDGQTWVMLSGRRLPD